MEWALLSNLDQELRQRVLKAARRRVFRANEVVFKEGDPGDALHVIARGHVAIRVSTPRGERVTLTVLGPGEAFGELSLLSEGSTRSATAAAVEGADTFSLYRREFDEIRHGNPGVERLLVDALAARVGRLTGHLVEALHEPVEVRVARRLLSLANSYADDVGAISVPMTQEDLASLAGTTRQIIDRILGELVVAGTIAITPGRIEVTDLVALERSAH